jgi:ABC-2 type transport system permease protein
VPRLTALVALRWRSDLRALVGARERLLGALVALPFGLLFSLAGAALAFVVVRAVDARHPEALLPLVSVAATLIGVFWALSPVLSGVAFTESHDLTRLMHFPVPPRVLVLSSFVANLARPMVLGELPMAAAVALALAGATPFLPLALAGLLASLVFIVAVAQATSLALHGLSRNRRLHDAALFVGLSLTFLVSIGPFLLLSGGGRMLGGAVRAVLTSALPALSPFGWGARAGVHAGRGEPGAFALFLAASLAATAAAVGASTWLAARIYRGDADAGVGPAARARRTRGFLPGRVGALVEKDLRVMWREPALKAMLVIGLAGPLLLLFFLTRLPGGRPPAVSLLLLATFVGLGGLGSNAFGLERRAVALLFGFPVARWRILVAKNLATSVARLPGLVTVGLAGLFLAPASLLPAGGVVVVATLLIATGVDNFLSILFPVALPAPGQNPYGRAGGGGRGLVGVLLNLGALAAALALSSPFVFLAWLPLLLGTPSLWLVSLPLGLAGAVAVYAILVALASGLLERREPEILERILGEA